jgi:hypothetical protein
MAYAPLGRGFLTATMKTLDALLPKDRRREHPRFSADNIGKNAALLEPIEKIAAAKKSTPAQIAIAWLLAQGADIVPIPGTKRRAYLEQNCSAVDIRLSKEEIDALAKAFPLNVTAGTRYPEKQLTSRQSSEGGIHVANTADCVTACGVCATAADPGGYPGQDIPEPAGQGSDLRRARADGFL